nr:hypothetical protein [Actinomyces trachealis]
MRYEIRKLHSDLYKPSRTDFVEVQVPQCGSWPATATAIWTGLHDEVMPSLGLTWNGPRHEIYLSDAGLYLSSAPAVLTTSLMPSPSAPSGECTAYGNRV